MNQKLTPINTQNLPDVPISRIAPTPSGYLHLGNAVNFLVTWALVRRQNGVLHLRIDDMDAPRFRKDVLEDIFECLDWLTLDWDAGPGSPDDFYRRFSLQANKEYYRERLTTLGSQSGQLFCCTCSRSAIKKISPSGLYPGTCREAGHHFIPGRHAIRLKIPKHTMVKVDGWHIDLAQTFGDFILWRKDDQPSYQLASLLEDERIAATLIVRGEDLLLSSAAQRYAAATLGLRAFPACRIRHHDLVLANDGEKLSKSRGAYALKDIRESGLGPQVAFQAAAMVLGLPTNEIHAAKDLLTPSTE
ncbi:MAG: tRNA glutamyl-Q synthetase [Desulfobacterales bacterium]|nr:MAG: tRNA glutamyl-Q synthetase [Desulfobacterales bacterium]